MRNHLFLLLLGTLFLTYSCSNSSGAESPAILETCTADLPADALAFSGAANTFTITYYNDWLQETEEKPESNAINYLFADTSLFFAEQIINTLQVNVQEGELPDEEDFIEANIQELKRRHKVLESGVGALNGAKSYWFVIEDPTITTLMYNLSDNGKFYTINLSTTAQQNSTTYLCELNAMLQTFQLQSSRVR